MDMLRGQGYDGASNMQGKNNGLKSLILKKYPQAYDVHCFAHQLQLSLVAVAKCHPEVTYVFEITSKVMNVVGASCKRNDILKANQHDRLLDALEKGEIATGRGLNQETNLQRSSDTRWGSHYVSLVQLTNMFPSVLDILEYVKEDGKKADQRVEARMLSNEVVSFEFVFTMHLMKSVLGISNELSMTLQKREEEIENAMRLVHISKHRLQVMRDDGWDSLIHEVSSFCCTHGLLVLNMQDQYVALERPRRGTQEKNNLVHFCIELFCVILDKQLMELNTRFSEANSNLLRYVGCLNPRDSFSSFNKEKLISLAQLYPQDFSAHDLLMLDNQLETFIIDMRMSIEFSEIFGIGDLAMKMVEMRRHTIYPLVYIFITLSLTFLVATATVERAFSAMKTIKNRLRNRMADRWLDACLVTYIESDIFDRVSNEAIMQRFQTMSPRRRQLSIA